MSYTPPSVGPAGLTISLYPDILQDNLQAYLNIFGQTQYVGTDSPIYQLISIFSLKHADANLGLQLAYNQTSPATAVGAGLDRVLKLNGLARSPYSYSLASLTLTGVSGTIIVNGFAQDVSGNLWALPSPTVLLGGTATVTATCTTPGNVVALVGQISLIATPVNGWTSVTNPSAAVAGVAVETDSKARARQAISVALPSLTTLQSTIAAVLAVSGVTRICPGYPTPGGPGTSIENPTAATDSWGNPPHSISFAVEGGLDSDVAMAIYGKRGVGCFTNGTTTVAVTDPNTGYVMNISFFRPTYAPIYVYMLIHGYSSAPTTSTKSAIQTALVNYLNSLSIGETLAIGALTYTAMAVNASLPTPSFGVQQVLASASPMSHGNGGSVLGAPAVSGWTADSGSPTPTPGQTVYTVPAVFPAGTTVVSAAGTTINVSANATSTALLNTVVFYTGGTLPTSDVTMPNFHTVAQGISANVRVSAV